MSWRLRGQLTEVRGELHAANARREWRERRGLRFVLRDADGVGGEGEASPLPGHSPDDLETCRAELLRLGEIEIDPEDPFAALPALGPAASFAVETALLDWRARREGVSVGALLPRRHDRLPLAGLVPPVDPLPAAVALLERGVRTLKLKLGRDLEGELALATELHRRGARLRFDANGSLDSADLPELLHRLERVEAEMLEEPCAGPWPKDSPVPLAVDESLIGDPDTALARLERGEAQRAVLKPTCLGGFRRIAALAEAVAERGGECILSHAFGGPLERAAAGALALAYGAPAAMGLGPHAGLAVWPAARDPHFDDHELHRSEAPGLGLRWPDGEAPWTR